MVYWYLDLGRGFDSCFGKVDFSPQPHQEGVTKRSPERVCGSIHTCEQRLIFGCGSLTRRRTDRTAAPSAIVTLTLPLPPPPSVMSAQTDRLGHRQSWGARGLPGQGLHFESLGGTDPRDPWGTTQLLAGTMVPTPGWSCPRGTRQSGVRAAGWAGETCRKGGGCGESGISRVGVPPNRRCKVSTGAGAGGLCVASLPSKPRLGPAQTPPAARGPCQRLALCREPGAHPLLPKVLEAAPLDTPAHQHRVCCPLAVAVAGSVPCLMHTSAWTRPLCGYPRLPREHEAVRVPRGRRALGRGLGEGATGSPRGSSPVAHLAPWPQAAGTHSQRLQLLFRVLSLPPLGTVRMLFSRSAPGPLVLGFRKGYVAREPFTGAREHTEAPAKAPHLRLCPQLRGVGVSVSFARSCPETCEPISCLRRHSARTKEGPSLMCKQHGTQVHFTFVPGP